MDAVRTGVTLSRQWFVAACIAVLAVLLIGGVSGYLIRGGATSATTRSAVGATHSQAQGLPAGRALNADSTSGYSSRTQSLPDGRWLNADSTSGY
jgi:hypothetical protein